MLTTSSPCVFITIFFFLCGSVSTFVSPVQKHGSRQGSGITQQTPLFMTKEMMRSASPSLLALGSLPLFFFFCPAQIGLG